LHKCKALAKELPPFPKKERYISVMISGLDEAKRYVETKPPEIELLGDIWSDLEETTAKALIVAYEAFKGK